VASKPISYGFGLGLGTVGNSIEDQVLVLATATTIFWQDNKLIIIICNYQ